MPCKKCKDEKYKWGNTGECKYATKEACEKANPKKYNKMNPTPLGKKTYEEYAKELKEFNLSKVERVQLGLIDDVKDRISSSNKIMQDMGKAQNQMEQAIKRTKAVTETAETQIKIQKNLIAETTKALSELGIKQEPKELKDLRTTNKSLEKYISNMPSIK
tara:strand:- start:1203 stop:1685 length:483 start_codon:yes stop_codon:yes gene_type:complete